MRSKEHVEENIELIIQKVIEEKVLREASQSFIKIRKDESSFLGERILLEKAVKKRRRWRVFI